MKLNWNFRRGGGVIGQIPSMGGGMDIFLEPHLVHSVSVCKQKKAAVVCINFCMLRNIKKGERGKKTVNDQGSQRSLAFKSVSQSVVFSLSPTD